MTVSCIGLGPNFPTSSGLGWIGSVKVGLDRVTQSGPMDNAALTCIMAVKRWQWRWLLLLLLFHFYKAPDISVLWRSEIWRRVRAMCGDLRRLQRDCCVAASADDDE